MKKLWIALILVIVPWAAGQAQETATARMTAIVGATVVNLEGGAPLRDAVVLVDGERIAAIGSADDIAVPAGAAAGGPGLQERMNRFLGK